MIRTTLIYTIRCRTSKQVVTRQLRLTQAVQDTIPRDHQDPEVHLVHLDLLVSQGSRDSPVSLGSPVPRVTQV